MEDVAGYSFNSRLLNAVVDHLHTYTHRHAFRASLPNKTPYYYICKTTMNVRESISIDSQDSSWSVICTNYCSRFTKCSSQIIFLLSCSLQSLDENMRIYYYSHCYVQILFCFLETTLLHIYYRIESENRY